MVVAAGVVATVVVVDCTASAVVVAEGVVIITWLVVEAELGSRIVVVGVVGVRVVVGLGVVGVVVFSTVIVGTVVVGAAVVGALICTWILSITGTHGLWRNTVTWMKYRPGSTLGKM